ncbi:MAG: InlB B-repeat-containing protein [Lachnospiraceae bacterium]|nr:InlB B-repeat-containing protein [Lachnospiraceae bacterium]
MSLIVVPAVAAFGAEEDAEITDQEAVDVVDEDFEETEELDLDTEDEIYYDIESEDTKATTYTYDPYRAAYWAKQSENVSNSTMLCAGFVSQCLRAGGLSDVDKRGPGDLLSYIESKKYGTKYAVNDTNIKKLKAGDVIVVLCKNSKHGSGYWGLHTIFVTAVSQADGYFRYSAKNNDHCNTKMTFTALKSYNSAIHCDSCNSYSNHITYIVSMNDTVVRNLYHFYNFSGKNYLYGTDFKSLNSDYYSSRDTSIVNISADSSTTHNGYATLKMVNTAAGSSGKDISIRTLTNGRYDRGCISDTKEMTLSFWAKSSVSGTKLNLRWGFESSSDGRNVTLSTSWTKYTIRMDKTKEYNDYIHVFANAKGTVWFSEMQLEDGTSATEFVPENMLIYKTTTAKDGGSYVYPAAPTRTGYSFVGWYTATVGGKRFDEYTVVKTGDVKSYAHWTANSYTVSFNANGGSVSTSSKSVTYDQTYGTLPTPTRTGYTFDGWYTSSSGGTRIYSSTKVTITSNQNLYAHWTKTSSDLFSDVTDPSAYYYDPVYWAAGKGITKGYEDGTFGVGLNCQRKDLLIFLWRYAGSPTKNSSGKAYGDARTMFNDLSAYGTSSAANKAIAWAYQEGICKGYSDGGFHPTDPILRKDVMIILYRYAGKPAVSGTLTFIDCQDLSTNSDTYKAVLWGYKKGITNGYSSGEYAGQFGLYLNCLREQIVTFLYRYDRLN